MSLRPGSRSPRVRSGSASAWDRESSSARIGPRIRRASRKARPSRPGRRQGHVAIVDTRARSSGRSPYAVPRPRHADAAQRQRPVPQRRRDRRRDDARRRRSSGSTSRSRRTATRASVEVHAFQRLRRRPDDDRRERQPPDHRGGRDGKIVKRDPADGEQPEPPPRHAAWPASSRTATTSSATRGTAWSANTTATGKVVWSYALDLDGRPRTPGHGPEGHGTEVFGAIRLPNGNTLIAGGNSNRVIEVDPEGKVVWSIGHDELPGITPGLGDDPAAAAQRQPHRRQLPRRPGQPAALRGHPRQEGRLDVQGLQDVRQ